MRPRVRASMAALTWRDSGETHRWVGSGVAGPFALASASASATTMWQCMSMTTEGRSRRGGVAVGLEAVIPQV